MQNKFEERFFTTQFFEIFFSTVLWTICRRESDQRVDMYQGYTLAASIDRTIHWN